MRTLLKVCGVLAAGLATTGFVYPILSPRDFVELRAVRGELNIYSRLELHDASAGGELLFALDDRDTEFGLVVLRDGSLESSRVESTDGFGPQTAISHVDSFGAEHEVVTVNKWGRMFFWWVSDDNGEAGVPVLMNGVDSFWSSESIITYDAAATDDYVYQLLGLMDDTAVHVYLVRYDVRRARWTNTIRLVAAGLEPDKLAASPPGLDVDHLSRDVYVAFAGPAELHRFDSSLAPRATYDIPNGPHMGREFEVEDGLFSFLNHTDRLASSRTTFNAYVVEDDGELTPLLEQALYAGRDDILWDWSPVFAGIKTSETWMYVYYNGRFYPRTCRSYEAWTLPTRGWNVLGRSEYRYCTF